MGVARQFLADGQWVTKLMQERTQDIRPCICCHNGCFNFCHYKGHANDQDLPDSMGLARCALNPETMQRTQDIRPCICCHNGCFNFCHYKGHANDQDLPDSMGLARCALNPETMQSKKYHLTPAKQKKKIAVIGGGIGGMEAALVLSKRGHQVTLYEKTGELGGVFLAAAAPSFKEKDRELIAWYRRELENAPVCVKLNTEVTDLAALDAEEILIATGAQANQLPVPGIELGIQAVDFLRGRRDVGQQVVIVGGGLTGCEIAYELYLQGKQPTIVEMKDDLIAMKGVCLANSSYLRDFFQTNQVPVHLETRLCQVLPDGVLVKDHNGMEFKIAADSVILSTGYHPAPLSPKSKHVHLVGDASAVGNLRTVIWGVWDVCMKL